MRKRNPVVIQELSSSASGDLTDKERRILDMNARGMTQLQIAKAEGYVADEPIRKILRSLQARGHTVSFHNIVRSTRYRQVAEMTLAGKSREEICAELGLALSTVKDMRNRARAEGLIPTSKAVREYRASPAVKVSRELRQLGTKSIDHLYRGRRYG